MNRRRSRKLRIGCSRIGGGVVRVVADCGQRIVGWNEIGAAENEGFGHVGRLGMDVLKRYRGRGIGERLFRRALRAANQHGLEKVELDVYDSNTPAVRFY